MLNPLPEGLRRGMCEAYDKSSYGRFMMCVAKVQDDTISAQDACSDVFDILGYDGGTSHNGKIRRDDTSKCRRPDLYRMFVEWSTSAHPVVVGEKKKVPFSNMLGPLPEGLRMGVYEAYGSSGYGQFMRRVVALEEGTMSLEEADNDVFAILGYDGGAKNVMSNHRLRDDFSKSHRPDLYRMFVEWSTGEQGVVGKKKKKNNVPFSFGVIKIATAPPETPCLDPQSMPGPLSENLSPEVCQELVLHELAFHQQVLEQLADKVHRLNKYCGSKEARIDTKMPLIPEMVVTAPPESLCLDSLTNEVLVKDLIALDAALTMSPTMLTALRVGAGGPSVPFSFGAMRELWQNELLKRVSTPEKAAV